MLSRTRPIEPCLPTPAEKPPSGPGWLHEIKHDGVRLMVWRNDAGVRLLTRNGHDWTSRFPLIRGAVEALRIGARKKARWSWSARSPDGKTVVVTMREDEIKTEGRRREPNLLLG